MTRIALFRRKAWSLAGLTQAAYSAGAMTSLPPLEKSEHAEPVEEMSSAPALSRRPYEAPRATPGRSVQSATLGAPSCNPGDPPPC